LGGVHGDLDRILEDLKDRHRPSVPGSRKSKVGAARCRARL
jgi:hypothetical protein